MSINNDLEILKKFAGEPETQAAPDGGDAVSGALDLEDLIAPGEDEPAPRSVQPSADDIETLKFKLQTVETALDEMRVKLSAAEKIADELAFFRHPNFSRVKQHIQSGGQLYLYPHGVSKSGHQAFDVAATQIIKIQSEAARQNYTPVFDVKITDISTQKRTANGKS